MYVHPFMAVLAIVTAALAGAAIAFIWANARITTGGKVEHTLLALAYAVSLLIFVSGMFNADTARWALPVAVMVMGSGTAWANWRAGVRFWLVFGLMAFLGGSSLLVMQVWLTTLSLGLFLALNLPWLVLALWLIGMIARWAWCEVALRRRGS